MHFLKILTILIAGCALCLAGICHAGELVVREVHQAAGSVPGKPLNLRVEELARDAKTSTVEIRFVSGASVPSSMFIMHAMYDIAISRGDRYIVRLSEHAGEQGKRTMLFGFSKEKVGDIATYYGTAQLDTPAAQLEQMDITMLDMVFKSQPDK